MILMLFDGHQDLEVVESVCSVDRLIQVLQGRFSTIPVVNMHGSLIGLVPKHFIIVLIENHCWYEHSRTTKGKDISSRYTTHNQREGDIEEQSYLVN